MKKSLCLLAVSLSVLAVSANAAIPPLVPLYSAYNAALNDNFYTIDKTAHSDQIAEFGYSDTGVVAYLEHRPQPNTRAFKRYYKGSPQTDTFLTTSASEQASVTSGGWTFEADEGFLYETQVPGSVPLYRLNKFNPTTRDQVHRYTRSSTVVANLTRGGWALDGVAGFVYATATPTISNGVILGTRCTYGRCVSGSNPYYRDHYFGNRFVGSTTRPAATSSIQTLRFDLMSPDFFTDANFPVRAGHMSFSVRAEANLYSPNIEKLCPFGSPSSTCTYYKGLGFLIESGSCSVCGGNPTFATQEWWWGEAPEVIEAPSFWNNQRLKNNVTYSVTLSVRDDGYMTYSVKQGSTVVASTTRWVTAPIPFDRTGYWLAHVNDASRDFTVYITNLSVTWQ